MQDRLKQILNRIKEFWNKFNKTQRILFISIFAAIVITIIVLAVVFTRKETIVLRECESASEATEVRTLLADGGISCQISSDYVVTVDEADYVEAKLILGSNNISAEGYSLQDAIDGGFTSTAADKERKYKAYLESKFAKDLEAIDGIKEARVTVNFPESDNTIFTENEDASITAELTLTKELSGEQAEAIGLMLANFVGSNNTNKVVVMDSNANLLYYGGSTNGSPMSTASQKVQAQFENAIIAKAEQLLLGTKLYSEVIVSPNLSVDFDNVEIIEHVYKAPDGTEQGLPSHSYVINSEGALTDAGGIAGTESNDDDTQYLIQNADGSTSTYSLSEYDWLQDETVTTTTKASGNIKYDESSVSIVAMKYKVLHEEDAQEQGILGDMTWEQFKAANSEAVPLEVDGQFVDVVSMGTGIAAGDISIIGYEKYIFYDKEKSSTSPFFVLQIILAVLIAGLLVFIIIRSTRPVAVGETE
ncbi:MAG: flagellar M-ring protein FliF C-terminal domain-containing protein, partial [Butyrivibrio sp.]